MKARAGLLARRGVERLFIPAGAARSVVPLPRWSRVPWDSAQMALVSGQVVAVVELGEPSGMLVLCDISSQFVALSGLSVESAGFWPEGSRGVRVGDIDVPVLDLAAALAQFQTRRTQHEGRQP